MNPASIVFHVIYVRGTVRALLPFVDTLLHWSECRYCLVANGCDAGEIALLRSRCQLDPRLGLVTLPAPEVLSHGATLNYLCRHTTGDPFCFMDSDILATCDFLSVLLPHLPGAAGVFSARPLYVRAGERVLTDDSAHLVGHHSMTADGVHLGGTYLALYDRAALDVGMTIAHDGFHACWWSDVPEPTRAILRSIGQARLRYDTGRVINLCLIQRGYRLRVQQTEALCHLGTYSDPSLRKAETPAGGSRLRRLAGRARRAVARLAYRVGGRQRAPDKRPLSALKIRKRLIHAYFAALTRALDADLPLPTLLRLGDAEIDPQIAQAATLLMELRRKPGARSILRSLRHDLVDKSAQPDCSRQEIPALAWSIRVAVRGARRSVTPDRRISCLAERVPSAHVLAPGHIRCHDFWGDHHQGRVRAAPAPAAAGDCGRRRQHRAGFGLFR